MYIPGRFRTASRPSNLSIFEASYFSGPSGVGTEIWVSTTSVFSSINNWKTAPKRGVQLQLKNCNSTGYKDNGNLSLFLRAYTRNCGVIGSRSQSVGHSQKQS